MQLVHPYSYDHRGRLRIAADLEAEPGATGLLVGTLRCAVVEVLLCILYEKNVVLDSNTVSKI